jgi:hypothetical protein
LAILSIWSCDDIEIVSSSLGDSMMVNIIQLWHHILELIRILTVLQRLSVLNALVNHLMIPAYLSCWSHTQTSISFVFICHQRRTISLVILIKVLGRGLLENRVLVRLSYLLSTSSWDIMCTCPWATSMNDILSVANETLSHIDISSSAIRLERTLRLRLRLLLLWLWVEFSTIELLHIVQEFRISSHSIIDDIWKHYWTYGVGIGWYELG